MARTGPAPRTSATERPLSPHLQIYRPSITMIMSILHRVTGAALFFGTLLVVVFLLALASGKTAFDTAQALYGSVLGKLVFFGYTWALIHHALGGARHLVWDTGAGFDRETRMRLGWATILGSLGLTIVLWLFFLLG